MNSEPLKGFKEQSQLLTKQQMEYNAMAERYKDKKLLQQEIARKSKNIVNEKINQNVPDVKAGMSKLNKDKALGSVKGVLNSKNNRMAGKPVGQRLIPGITLQTYKDKVFMIDFGMQ